MNYNTNDYLEKEIETLKHQHATSIKEVTRKVLADARVETDDKATNCSHKMKDSDCQTVTKPLEFYNFTYESLGLQKVMNTVGTQTKKNAKQYEIEWNTELTFHDFEKEFIAAETQTRVEVQEAEMNTDPEEYLSYDTSKEMSSFHIKVEKIPIETVSVEVQANQELAEKDLNTSFDLHRENKEISTWYFEYCEDKELSTCYHEYCQDQILNTSFVRDWEDRGVNTSFANECVDQILSTSFMNECEDKELNTSFQTAGEDKELNTSFTEHWEDKELNTSFTNDYEEIAINTSFADHNENKSTATSMIAEWEEKETDMSFEQAEKQLSTSFELVPLEELNIKQLEIEELTEKLQAAKKTSENLKKEIEELQDENVELLEEKRHLAEGKNEETLNGKSGLSHE